MVLIIMNTRFARDVSITIKCINHDERSLNNMLKRNKVKVKHGHIMNCDLNEISKLVQW